MNIFKRIRIQCVHLKILFFGDKELKEIGYKYLPCRDCGYNFLSYMHFHDDYDCICRECLQKYKVGE